jgi:hypothetical protein
MEGGGGGGGGLPRVEKNFSTLCTFFESRVPLATNRHRASHEYDAESEYCEEIGARRCSRSFVHIADVP